MLIKKLQAIFHPEQYHGWGRTKSYFEGWYFKIVNKNEDKAFAIIPGIAMNKNGEQHAFIQILDGKKLTSEYHQFDAMEFQPKSGKFELKLGNNFFSEKRIVLDIPSVNGELSFKDVINWPNKWYSPGIMGPYTFVPFMECYHGILSMDHTIEGELKVQNERIYFTSGRGYMEKDWGHSFPSAYFWIQSNHFSKPGISFKASVAKIPWLRGSFVGFIAGLWVNDRLFEFTTYNSTKLSKSFADTRKVELIMENRRYILNILVQRNDATELASPILGFMDGRIKESMTSELEVLLFDKKYRKVIFHDKGRNAGLEVAGNVKEIMIN